MQAWDFIAVTPFFIIMVTDKKSRSLAGRLLLHKMYKAVLNLKNSG
jgi:hypothetical protein